MVRRYRFGRGELLPAERMLRWAGETVVLGSRAFDLLLALVVNSHRAVGREELIDAVWPGLVVEENNLSVQVSGLRKVLGQDAIATVAGRGYRFAMVVEVDVAGAESASAARASANVADEPCYLVALAEGSLAHSWWQAAVATIVPAHAGRVMPGHPQGLFARFVSGRAAAACALRLREDALAASHRALPWMGPRIGLCGDGDFGSGAGLDAVVAAAIAGAAGPGEIVVSAGVCDQLICGLDGDVEDLGTPGGGRRLFRLSAPCDGAATSWAALADMHPTVAVLPFADYHPADPGFGIGDVVADQVTEVLSRSELVHVTSRLSTNAFRHRDASLAMMSRHLGASFIVSGRYWRADSRVSIHVELADAVAGNVVWSSSFSDRESAVLHADSDLIQHVVTELTRAIFVAEVRSARHAALPTLASHTLLLSAIGLLYRLSPTDFERAKEALETLRERAPRHPAPLAWLARWHLFRVVQGWSTDRDEDGRLALRYASEALEIDPDSSLALTMLGNVQTNYVKDLAAADSLYDRALELNPNASLAWLQKGNASSFRGEGAQALSCVEKAVGLSPIDPANHFYLAILAGAALAAGEYPRAIDAARQSLRLNSEHVSTHRTLAIALSLSGRLPEARLAVEQVVRREPRLTVRDFVARSPGAASGLAEKFGLALQAAGLP